MFSLDNTNMFFNYGQEVRWAGGKSAYGNREYWGQIVKICKKNELFMISVVQLALFRALCNVILKFLGLHLFHLFVAF